MIHFKDGFSKHVLGGNRHGNSESLPFSVVSETHTWSVAVRLLCLVVVICGILTAAIYGLVSRMCDKIDIHKFFIFLSIL